MAKTFFRPYLDSILAREISAFARYYDAVWQLQPLAHDPRELLGKIECPSKNVAEKVDAAPNWDSRPDERHIALLNGNLNHHFDVEALLASVRAKCSRNTRVVAVVYNSYLRSIYTLATWLGLRLGEVPSTFLTQSDIENFAKLSGFEVVRVRPVGYFPVSLFGLGNLINAFFAALPVVRWLGLAQVLVLRPCVSDNRKYSLSVVIPARNEKGNIENALKRLDSFHHAELEVIFVEGHSSDGTWEEIQRVASTYSQRFRIVTAQQTGKGKADAVRLGFPLATGDLLTILDADLTMPPEHLERFYLAYTKGLGDFVNGSRLVYPMEGEAMRFLNWLGNIFFAKALSTVLDVRIGDSLCGTKLMSRRDYLRFTAWRKDFGDFDPFGDFELIFPAAVLGLGIVDVPVRYLARTYGSTNIHRFHHGLILLKMTLTGLLRIRIGNR